MTHYWAVFVDETGCEFGAGIEAATKAEAYRELQEMYVESRIVQLESPEERLERERAMHEQIERELFGDYWDRHPDDDDDWE